MSIGEAFESRRNSLNLIRLALACVVILSHSFPLGAFGDEPVVGNVTFGTMAVAVFFAISGYLITGSRESAASGWRFMWHRVLRILPGYYICLLVIAVIAAPLAWGHLRGGLAGYPVADSVRYVVGNLALKTSFVPTIPGTQEGIDSSVQYWNGAAWSLFFEFLCYIGVAILAAFGLLRTWVIAATLALTSGMLLAWELAPGPMVDLLFHSHDTYRLFTTGTVFMAGALLYLLRDRIPDSPVVAAGCGAVVVGGVVLLDRPEWFVAGPVAYAVIWLAIHLPFSGVLSRTDVSYGTYIYGYPIATLLTIYGVNEWGILAYNLVTFAIVVPLALASWFGIERRAMRLKNAVPSQKVGPRQKRANRADTAHGTLREQPRNDRRKRLGP
ncbi:acyltransferase [Aeromicrobium senzhongii]|uniref:Acyltransferase n=1 Tax=Aeromicrobium senzhongii TaxID=2663859 RepID=A0ABX6SVM0_9ACTN|nr:acyltransferase [Aeromicrobium senzhongii]QNL94310.1 acyltransferase [Aeromicrobium senzhongii]